MEQLKTIIAEVIESIKAPIRELMEKEPARVTAAVAAAITAAVAWIASQLGITIPEAWVPWIILIVGGAIVEVIRKLVFAPATVQVIADAATFEAPGTQVDIGTPPEGTT